MHDELDSFFPDRASIKNFTRTSSALFLPCLPRLVRLGTGFDSRQVDDPLADPWRASIFEETIGREKASVVDLCGTQSSYKKSFSTDKRDTSEHFSASMGVTIGNDLLSGSVSGSYDKAVSESEQGTHASKTVSSRVGRIFLRQIIPGPEVRRSGLKISSSDFKQRYGDYFVAAYTLGADRGVFLHAKAHAQSQSESKEVTVSVHTVFGDKSHTDRESFASASKTWDIIVMGYDTLTARFERLSSSDESQERGLSSVYNDFSGAIEKIMSDVAERSRGLDLKNNHQLSFSECDEVYRRGLVMQLVLLPYTSVAGLAR